MCFPRVLLAKIAPGLFSVAFLTQKLAFSDLSPKPVLAQVPQFADCEQLCGRINVVELKPFSFSAFAFAAKKINRSGHPLAVTPSHVLAHVFVV